ncbi:hypothetical protein ACHAW6_015279 [Cyclotella cf. meneghiniana]
MFFMVTSLTEKQNNHYSRRMHGGGQTMFCMMFSLGSTLILLIWNFKQNGWVEMDKLDQVFERNKLHRDLPQKSSSDIWKLAIGVEMSDCSLAECRHCHNHRCLERLHFGFPVPGHYNTLVVDQLQNLVRENPGIQIFPYWSNASKFKSINKTVDTIALHHESLHNKLEDKCKELGHVNLTREQKHLAKAMGATLPFLPFMNKDE